MNKRSGDRFPCDRLLLRGALVRGLESARANRLPIAVLWCVAAGLVGAYFLLPGAGALLEPVANWQRAWGWKAAALSLAVFCGLIPGVFQLTVREIRPERPFLTIFLQVLWCGFSGVVVNRFFAFQAWLFGNDASFATLLLKTLVDQFVWTVLVIAPANSVFFFWLGRGCSFVRTRREWPQRFLAEFYLPNLVSNWCVWIPAIFMVYAFPVALQVHLNGLVCACWILMCNHLGRSSGR